MSAQQPSEAEVSYVGLAGQEPWDFYRRLRARGGAAIWDEETNAYLVPSFEHARQIAMATFDDWVKFDESGHAHIDIDGPTYRRLIGGPDGERHIWLLQADDYRRMHRWWMALMSSRAMEPARARIRAIVDLQIDRFIEDGSAELSAAFCDRVPARAIAALMGLPWQDDEWIDSLVRLLSEAYRFEVEPAVTPEMIERSREAGNEFARRLRPLVEARRAGRGDDLISQMWAEGPDIFDDWHAGDVIAGVRHIFAAGSETTASAIANALYLLLAREPALIDQLRVDTKLRDRFIEESLRLVGVVQFDSRRATRDTVIGDTKVQAGDTALMLLGSTGRDERKYQCPVQVDLERPSPRDHLGFGAGARSCVGAVLARIEIQEGVAGVLERLIGIELDPTHPAPAFRGFLATRYAPLHVRFAPGRVTSNNAGS